jgi:nitrate reductase delta subunit
MAEPVAEPKLVSMLLQYPGAETVAAAASLTAAERSSLDRRLGRFLDWYLGTPLEALEREYVRGFDFSRRASLHLSYHLHGDQRQRGLALLRLKQAYAEAGLDAPETELPDYLPLMLEFAALQPERGRELLREHRVSIELVRTALREEESPFAPLLDLVADRAGGLSRPQLARLRRLAAEGPPTEEVGLEPFAPPEVMPPPGGAPPLPMVGGYE